MEIDLWSVVALLVLFVFGAVVGSFCCCQAWRLRYKYTGKKSPGKRSVCLKCKHVLRWYDNIPVFSWLILRGKCRYCKAKIGAAEILSEVLMGAMFMLLGGVYLLPILMNWGYLVIDPVLLWTRLLAYLVTTVMLVVLGIAAIYDAKWGELPVSLLVAGIICGAVILGLRVFGVWYGDGNVFGRLLSAGIGVVILVGPCYLLYKLSHERLMGGGDWWFALALALALSDWWLSLWAVFLANLLGDIIMMPTLLREGNHKIHYGPFLLIGFVITLWLANCLPALIPDIGLIS